MPFYCFLTKNRKGVDSISKCKVRRKHKQGGAADDRSSLTFLLKGCVRIKE